MVVLFYNKLFNVPLGCLLHLSPITSVHHCHTGQVTANIHSLYSSIWMQSGQAELEVQMTVLLGSLNVEASPVSGIAIMLCQLFCAQTICCT